MSTSEFEQQHGQGEEPFGALSVRGPGEPPDDFSEDDLAFAQELDELFAIHNEELPPYFVQTLLEPDDPRFQPVVHKFEQQTCARVFRRLKLNRCLFPPPLALKDASRDLRKGSSRKRPLLALGLVAMLMLIMLFTVAFTAPSFAAGIQLLLQGGRTGVYQVSGYPDGVRHHAGSQQNAPIAPNAINLLTAQHRLNFSLFWPQFLPKNYSLTNIYLHQDTSLSWVDGPMIELNYTYSAPNTLAHGTGQIAIREFKLKPSESIFQVVQFGAATPILVDKNGQARAIYIDGQWVWHNKMSPVWEFGKRSELIYQRDGIVFWIAGDQRDGINKDALLQITQSLQVIDINRLLHTQTHLMIEPFDVLLGSFASDVVAVFSDDGESSLHFSQFGVDQPPSPEKHMPKGGSHSH